MTQKSRRRKAAQRVRTLSRQKDEATQPYSFYHNSRIVEVVAPSLRDAEDHFQMTYGYHPGATVQERLE